jgi:hypothetical protein
MRFRLSLPRRNESDGNKKLPLPLLLVDLVEMTVQQQLRSSTVIIPLRYPARQESKLASRQTVSVLVDSGQS